MTTSLAHIERSGEGLIDRTVMSGATVKARLDMILDIATHAMKEDVDFGKVPGTDKPSLWQAGADKLCVAFQIAPTVKLVESIGELGERAYRVIVSGVHQPTSMVLGEGAGECSSAEEKYSWRWMVHQNEWDATPEDRRRTKFKRDGSAIQQIKTNPADVANTVLKMAVKRAKIAMVLAVTGAAAIFTQDVEDLAEELRVSMAEEQRGQNKATVQPPQRKSQQRGKGDADAKQTEPGLIAKVTQPDGKKFYRIEVKGDARFFTVWPDEHADAIKAAEAVQGTQTKVVLTFTEKKSGDKTYFNVTGVAAAPAEASTSEKSDAVKDLQVGDIFGDAK